MKTSTTLATIISSSGRRSSSLAARATVPGCPEPWHMFGQQLITAQAHSTHPVGQRACCATAWPQGVSTWQHGPTGARCLPSMRVGEAGTTHG